MRYTIGTILAVIILFISGILGAVLTRPNDTFGQLRTFISSQVGTSPVDGYVLQTDGSNSTWVSTSTLGISGGAGGSGTTTINGVTGPTFSFATGTATGIGLTIATSSGTLTFTPTVSSGYNIPLTASTTNWNTAYGWGDHSLAGYLTGVAWGNITGTLSNQTDLQTALNAKQDTLTTGNLTESVTGLQFDATRSVIGGAAALSLSAGYTIPLSASTTEWSTAYASTTALTPAYIRGLFSGTSPVSYNSGTGAIGITADAIGDTELAFNTGQNLTTTSAPTFASSTFSNLTSAVLLTTAGGLLQEYAGTACTNQFVRSLSALASATCAAVNLTSDVTGTLPIANGGTGETSATNAFAALAPSLAKGGLISSNGVSNPSALLVGSNGTILMASSSASLGIAWTATSSLGITASAGGANTQLQYNNAGALAGLSTLTTDGSSLTMTGTSTLATTTISQLTMNGDNISDFTGTSLAISGGALTFTPADDSIPIGKLSWETGPVVIGRGSGSGSLSALTSLPDDFIIEPDLSADVAAVDGDYLQYDSTGTNFTWREASEVRTDLGLVIGTNVQAYDADLTTYAGITPSANVQSLLGAADYAAFVALIEAAIESALDTLDNLTGGRFSGYLGIPNGTNPTVDAAGEIALDTTDNQLIVGTSTTATVVPTQDIGIYGFQIASTSAKYASGTVMYLPPQDDGFNVTKVRCNVTSGTSKVVIAFGKSFTCTLAGISDSTIVSAAVAAGATSTSVTMGATSGSVDDVNISIFGNWTRQ